VARRSELTSSLPRAMAQLGAHPLAARVARRLPTAPPGLGARTLEPRLVWIFGSPRSGSTWLLALLCHPLVPDDQARSGVRRLAAPEADPPPAIPINEPYAQEHLAPAFDVDLGPDELAIQSTVRDFRHALPNYFLSDRYSDAWRPALRRLVLTRLSAQVQAVSRDCATFGGAVVIKEPNGSIGADFVMSLLPASRMIFLLRDGRDVVDSMVDAQMPGGWLASPSAARAEQHRRDRLALVRRESHLWVARTRAVRRAFDAHPESLRFLVRYEDARRDTATVVSALEAWLGLRRSERGRADALRWNDFDTIPADAKGTGKPLRAASPGLWRENLDAHEQAAMVAIMGDELAAAGYE
jgi:hypothetical protein